MKTAGILIDFYDDPTGSVLRGLYPTQDDLPDVVKTAHFLNQDERDVLRNEAYALTMVNDGTVLRKFACVDPGNTALSMIYFEKTASSLPEEAKVIAASNIAAFCESFGIPISDTVKTASYGMKRERDPERKSYVNADADWERRTNMSSMTGGVDSGRVIPAANSMKTASALIHKDGNWVSASDAEIAAASNEGYEGPQVIRPALIVGKSVKHSPVDVTKLSAKPKIEKKAASRFALGQRYPIDSYSDVEKSIDYFNNYWTQFQPEERKEYCTKVASRASELGIALPEPMSRYGSSTYSSDLEAHLINRKYMVEEQWAPVYDELKTKTSSVSPQEFASMLAKVDEASGAKYLWDGKVCDPWYATFGTSTEKLAEAYWSWKSSTGEMVTGEQLKELAFKGRALVHKHFSSDMTNAFVADPVAIFESMPDPHKKILCNLANGVTNG